MRQNETCKPRKTNWLFILGQTASGKTDVSINVAKKLGGEIISVDSTMVYRMMDIGTAKPTLKQRERIKHHLIDILDPSETYSAGRFIKDAQEAVSRIEKAGKVCIFVGATFLYYKAFVYGMFSGPQADHALREEMKAKPVDLLYSELERVDPEAAKKIHKNDQKRIIRALEVYYKTKVPISHLQKQFQSRKYDIVAICLKREKSNLVNRIKKRVEWQIKNGLIEEVKRLLSYPRGWNPEARKAIAYRETIEYIEGKYDLETLKQKIVRDNIILARRQNTWLKSLKEVVWMPVGENEKIEKISQRILDIFTKAQSL
jgi:tRNA dimethylallyltransferase